MISRQDRYRQDFAFKRLFYKKLDEILDLQPFQTLDSLQYHIEYLIGFCEQIDGKSIYQPLRNFDSIAYDMHCAVYGIIQWSDIKELIQQQGQAKQVDLIKRLDLDKAKSSNFFYLLSNLGVLCKTKSGSYNAYSLVCDRLDKGCLERGWPALFDSSRRLPILNGNEYE